MKRQILCFLIGCIVAATLILCVGCSGSSSQDPCISNSYDAEYVAPQDLEETICIEVEVQHRHHHRHWWKHWYKWRKKHKNHTHVEEVCADVHYLSTPGHFILRGKDNILFVNAEDLLTIRPDLTIDGGEVCILPEDLDDADIMWYPGFLFDEEGYLNTEFFFDWLDIEFGDDDD
jgi:hypothetical protein